MYVMAACPVTYIGEGKALWGEPNEPTCSKQHHIYILMQYVDI